MYQIIASILIMICLTMIRLVAMLLGEHGVDYVCFRASKARKLVEPYLGDRVPFTYNARIVAVYLQSTMCTSNVAAVWCPSITRDVVRDQYAFK